MNVQEYAPLARRTLKEYPFQQHMTHMSLGLVGEVGELIDAVKKVVVYGKDFDSVNAMEEIGDVAWYLANLLPELQVDPIYVERALYRGIAKTKAMKIEGMRGFELANAMLAISKAVNDQCATLVQLDPEQAPGTGYVVSIVEHIAGNVGILCGMLQVDPAQAMERNIAKLAARYGDKYSDLAAINRDTAVEREVLEGGEGAGLATQLELVHPKGDMHIYDFNGLIEYGKHYCAERGMQLVDGLPWAFPFVNRIPVTHESPNCYRVGNVAFRRGQHLRIVGKTVTVEGDPS